ncbi:RNA polymerase sigma factor [Sphingobacterium sp. HJSM2_6]|uniref:RNA polymerase sigma factor n=1 Tax=Sphingobacterium sp. HJSM2_6 TaxID=3366264 RepID=UPI003BCAFA31
MFLLSPDYEKELLLQLKEGDCHAFEKIYLHYFTLLYTQAYHKIGDSELAKDIVQDIFTNIWKNRSSLNIQKSLSSYLFISVRNHILDRIAKAKNEEKYLDSLSSFLASEETTADGRLREKMLNEEIEKLLAGFSPRIREIFELSRRGFLSHKEIAGRLNISEQTVRGYIKEALRILKFKLESILFLF